MNKYYIIPSKLQWAKWTMPSKATYISLWLTVVGVLLAMIPYIFSEPSRETIISRLDSDIKQKNYEHLANYLEKIQYKDNIHDAWLYYNGLLSLRNIGYDSPLNYFNNVPYESPFYLSAQKKILSVPKRDKAFTTEEAGTIVKNNLERHNIKNSLYYISIFLSNQKKWDITKDLSEIENIYFEFGNNLRQYIDLNDFKTPSTELEHKGQVVRIDGAELFSANSTALVYLSRLLGTSNYLKENIKCKIYKEKALILLKNNGERNLSIGFEIIGIEDMVDRCKFIINNIKCQ